MTKQHFIALATEIAKEVRNATNTVSVEDSARMHNEAAHTCNLICRVAPQLNPRFDADKFRKACGL